MVLGNFNFVYLLCERSYRAILMEVTWLQLSFLNWLRGRSKMLESCHGS
jgi:hypothetical protein